MTPTFMLRIWHGGDWLKRDLAQPIYGQVERGSPFTGWFIAFINEKFIPLIFMCKCIDVYIGILMADIFIASMFLLFFLYEHLPQMVL